MRRIPWHVALRADRKAILTAMGVALGVAFALVSFAVPDGLQTETISPEGPFADQDAIVSRADGARLDARDLARGDASLVLLFPAWTASGERITLTGIQGPAALDVASGEARIAGGTGEGTVALRRPANATLAMGAPIEEVKHVARGWVLVDDAWLRAYAGIPQHEATYAIVPRLTADDAADLRARGYAVDPAPAVEPFFRESAREVARDLGLVVAFSGILVAIFTYQFLRSDIRDRQRELGLLRALGLRATGLLALLVARAAAIGGAGTAAGLVLGAMLLSGAGQLTGNAVLRLEGAPLTYAWLAASFLAACILGALVPALAFVRAPIRDTLEAPT